MTLLWSLSLYVVSYFLKGPLSLWLLDGFLFGGEELQAGEDGGADSGFAEIRAADNHFVWPPAFQYKGQGAALGEGGANGSCLGLRTRLPVGEVDGLELVERDLDGAVGDRKSTRLNSS